ncbi:FecR domain-containing protein [Candidatus Pelagibacter sp.]|nr:FecR domain-containing protein [Candidatus Pelagibacter sp.]
MKKLLSVLSGLIFMISTSVFAEEKLTIEKQLVGIVGAISGTVKTETRELKAGDKIYLNETIVAGAGSGTQILLLDQSTFTIGEDSEVVMDTFIFDPATNDGKIVASVKQGSLKVISGLISKKNPDSLTVEVPEGTLGSRGTEFQTIVSKGKTDTLLIGPGKNNTLGMRPGAVLVGNSLGSTLLDNPYSITSMTKGKAPGQAKKITKNQLKKFNKKMKALRVAKLSPDEKKGKRKEMKKQLKKELKSMGFEKEEIKSIIRENIQKDKEKKVAIKKERAEKKKAKKKKAKAEKKKNKKKKATKKGSKKKKVVKKKEGKKKKATKKKATKKKATKKKAVKKKPAKKKKAVKKKAVKKKKVVKKKKKVVKKKPKKKIKKKVAKKRKIVKKKRAAKKKKAKKKRRKKK